MISIFSSNSISWYSFKTSSEDNPSEDESGNLMSNCIVFGIERSYTAGAIIPYEVLKEFDMLKYQDDWNKALLYNIFVHGRSNIIDEINYFDSDETNQILPYYWLW